MAVTLATLPSYTVKVDNQDTARRNLTTEHFDVTWDGTATTYELPTELNTVLNFNFFEIIATGAGTILLSTDLVVTNGAITIDPSATPANGIKHRVVLTGLSY